VRVRALSHSVPRHEESAASARRAALGRAKKKSEKRSLELSIWAGLVRRMFEPRKNQEGEAMKFLSFIRHSEKFREMPPPPGMMDAMVAFVQQSKKDGTLVDTGGLLPSKDGAKLRLSDGEITVTDGPFTETKEVIGGWAILNAPNKAEAIRLAKRFLELHKQHWPGFEGECEVRPMFDPGVG
jgi:hypothetical protein